MTSRRAFIKKSGRWSLSAFALTSSPFFRIKKPIGLQLYTVREEMAKDPETTIRKVAGIGYNEVESFGYQGGKYFGMLPKAFSSFLKENRLTHPSGHYMLTHLSDNWEKAVEDAVAAGQKYMVVAYLLDSERKSIDDYKKIAAQFNKAAGICRKSGIQFGYHNHNFEFFDLNGQQGYDILLKETDPNLVKFELDLYWASYAGKDPVAMFRQHPGRFPLWHVKDMDNTTKKFFTEVGNGVIDFKSIFAHAREAGMEHFFVEQDICPGSPFSSIETSYRYISKNLIG